MNNPLIFFLNTHGVWMLVLFTFFYEFYIEKAKEVAWHSVFSSFTALFFSIILKQLFLMPRPFLENGTHANAGLTHLYSMPSSHTAVAFALATSVALHNKRVGVFLLAISSIIGFGRVAANVHYPSDIIVGLLLGVLVGVFFDTIHFSGYRKDKAR